MNDHAAPLKAAASRLLRKYGLWLLLVVLSVSLLGFLVLPPILKSILVDELAAALHRPVKIASVRFNPYVLSVQIDGFAIEEKEGGDQVLGFDRLYVNLESSSLFRGGPVISELQLAGPRLKLVRLADGRFNFSDLIDEFLARPDSNQSTPSFAVSNIQITGGQLEYDDLVLDEKHVVSELSIALPFVSSLPSSTEIFVEPAFSALIDGSPLVVQGKSKPFAKSRESELALDFRDLHLGRYLAYSPIRLPIQVISGALDSELKLGFRRGEDDHSASSVSGKFTIKDLLVKDREGGPLLALRRLEVELGDVDPFNGKFTVERLAVDGPEIYARVSRQGTINWIDFFNKQLGSRAGAEANAITDRQPVPPSWSLGEARITGGVLRWFDESHGTPFQASIDAIEASLKGFDSSGDGPAEFDAAWRLQAGQWIKGDAFSIRGGHLRLAKREVAIDEVGVRGTRLLLRRVADGRIEFVPPPSLRAVQAARKDSAAQWKLKVARYHGQDLGLRFEDGSVSPPVTHTIEGMTIDAENLSTEPGTKAKVSTRFRINGGGEVEVGGNVQAFPLEADLKVGVTAFELLPVQPYFTERLNIEVSRGQVALNGDLQLRQSGAGSPDPGRLSGGFAGQLTVGDLHAVDKLNAADFLKWKSLYIGKVEARLNPDSLSIGEVALADFFARVIISRDGKLNLLQIVRQNDKATPRSLTQPAATGAGTAVATVTPGTAMPPIRIGRITLQGGDIRFSDNFVKPNYSANLKKVGGTISGLSSAADSVATLDLRGSYDNLAPLSISGQVNPLSPKPYLDVQAEIKGVELNSLSPYSGKYAGYAIEKGKLSLFVKYQIENNRMTAENRVFLDQLTFGDAVDSPDATKLPVMLAVALLKNRNGEIDINLPIAGSLDDPEFSVGGLVVKVITNLLVKAVTSPFALLGSIFGGGEELSNLEFDSGQATLTPQAQQRIENLAKALNDRPALKLDIEGRADPDGDTEGLKRARLDQKVRELKREDLAKKSAENGSTDAVEVSAGEYPALLERVYRAEKFPKPRNLIGMVKGLPVEEMEKLILANSIVDEEDLRELADRRAKAVLDGLVARQVDAERLFLLPVKLAVASSRSDGSVPKESRVALSLK